MHRDTSTGTLGNTMTSSQNGSSPIADEIGSVLADRYTLTELVGRGGMASVYRAFDESLGRTVAVKIFRSELADASDVRRQREEISLLAGLNHYGLVTLFDAVVDHDGTADRAFLVMEYIDGHDLNIRLRSGALDSTTVALIGADVAEALAYVHFRGVVHRDIKPGNILLPNLDGDVTGARAKLADFGIARLVDGTRMTATGSVLGTANYLSPEQAMGGALSPQSDVYSLGLVLLEALTGERPFPGSALESVAARLSRDPVVPLELGEHWVTLIAAMTARDPQHRPSAAESGEHLRRIASADQVAPPVTGAAVIDHTEPFDAATQAAMSAATPAPQSTVAMAAPVADPTTPTRVMQMDPTASTVAVGHVDAEPRAQQTTRQTDRKSTRGRNTLIGVVLALLIGAGIWFAVTTLTSNSTDTPAVQYPAVEGELGDHLEQLQRSVTP